MRYLFFCLLTMCSCSEQDLKYPSTKKVDVKDTYFGVEVEDPYRWLENDTSEETSAWVDAQNRITFAYLNVLPNRDALRNRATDLMNYPRYGTPFKKAGKYFFYKNDGLQNQSVLYATEGLDKEPKVLFDPNTLSEDGTVALSGIELSDDAKYLVYKISRSGSDWNEIFVMDTETGKLLSDYIKWVKFSGLSWYDNGFYYSAYDRPSEGSELSKSNEYQKIYYHRLGDTQDKDVLVMQDSAKPKRMFSAEVTDDKRFLVFAISEGTKGNASVVKNLSTGKLIPLMEQYEYDFHVVDNIDNNLYVLTNFKAPKYRLLQINVNRPDEKYWKEIIPEGDNVLVSIHLVGGKIVASFMKDARSEVKVYDYEGVYNYTIELPGIGSAGSFSGEKDDSLLFYSYTSFNTPGEIWLYNLNTKKGALHYRPEVKFNPDDYVVKQEFFASKDGTKIPMFIVHKKGLEQTGSHPALLYGYGGFNSSQTPSFSTSRIVFLENGGVLAVANIRGGGEYGEEWHMAGTKMQKQNVFDDFISAAEYLIQTKYTNSSRLAIEGGSNGGLLIGAVINQRPDLFKVALPRVGVMDMLRFQKFTIGWAWASDYGTSDDSKEMFAYLKSYSPYHNIRKDVDYPAVMAMTADHDDRVVPAHSFKYISRLQEYNKGSAPALIRIDAKAGHGSGKPTAKVIDETVDIWSFVFYHLEMKAQ